MRRLHSWLQSPSRRARIVLASLAALLVADLAFAATQVSINGITFQFDRDYQTGSFVDGMPWVVASGGGVTITRITPDAANGRHGWEVNPTSNEIPKGQQGCDSSKGSCDLVRLDSRLKWANGQIYQSPPGFPQTFSAGSSILKAISYTGGGDCFSGTNGAPARTCLETAAVLTVMSSPPPSNAFRPPYIGSSKPLFTTSSIDFNTKLPNPPLPDVAGTQSLAHALGAFGDGGTWIVHPRGGQAGRNHPRLSVRQPGGAKDAAYGCQMGMALENAMLRAAQSGSLSERQELVNRAVQVGIDLYYASVNGKDWNSQGCIHIGRKPTILFAGHMLSPQSGSELLLGYTGGSQEDDQTMAGPQGAVWGNKGQCVSNSSPPRNNSTQHACDKLRDGGSSLYGPGANGSGKLQPTLDQIRSSGNWSMAAYQRYTDPFYGSAAVGRIYDLEDEWNYPPFFEYVDRIGQGPWRDRCEGHCNDYLFRMFDAYGSGSQLPTGPPPAAPLPAPVLLD